MKTLDAWKLGRWCESRLPFCSSLSQYRRQCLNSSVLPYISPGLLKWVSMLLGTFSIYLTYTFEENLICGKQNHLLLKSCQDDKYPGRKVDDSLSSSAVRQLGFISPLILKHITPKSSATREVLTLSSAFASGIKK